MPTNGSETPTGLSQTAPVMDRWSLKRSLWAASPLVFTLGVAVLIGHVALGPLTLLLCALSVLLIIVLTAFSIIRAIVDLVRGLPRLAASGVVGTGIFILSVYLSMFMSQAEQEPNILDRLPEFQRIVAEQRMRMNDKSPLRMVVFVEDHSLWVGTTSFEQVIYDETDKIDHNPDELSGYWIYPKFSTGVIDVGQGRKFVERMSGHFYHVWIADP